jgi:hypothetical protein
MTDAESEALGNQVVDLLSEQSRTVSEGLEVLAHVVAALVGTLAHVDKPADQTEFLAKTGKLMWAFDKNVEAFIRRIALMRTL